MQRWRDNRNKAWAKTAGRRLRALGVEAQDSPLMSTSVQADEIRELRQTSSEAYGDGYFDDPAVQQGGDAGLAAAPYRAKQGASLVA